MKKHILIINGSGGVGKDTFVNCLKQFIPAYHTSIINPVKKIAREIGWEGKKDPKDRKFLSDLKILIDKYNDGNYTALAKTIKYFLDGNMDEEVLCVDIREKAQIERVKKDFPNVTTILVTRDSVPHITSNMADAGVFDMKYDYYVKNNGTLQDLKNEAKSFIRWLSYEN